MTDTLKYQRLSDLAAHVQKNIEDLESGNLPLQQIEDLAHSARELYERLVVLRYKAYDREVKQEKPVFKVELSAEQPEVREEEIQPIAFRIQPETPVVSPNQVNLIDAIEEVTKEEEQKKEQPKTEPASFSSPLFKASESLNDKLSKTVGTQETLAQKMEHTPISDLKKAISLNQRFQFSKELFKGNNQDYEVTIDRLNSSSREEALKTLESLRSKYSWNNESAIAQDFAELIERRYLG
jgi:flagellar hook-basal body complex protein FliE